MGATFVITLREAFEASLILGIVYTYLQKIGAREHYRYVTWGGALGLSASLAMGLGITYLSGPLLDLGPDLIGVTVILAAVVLLTWHAWWMQQHARAITGHVQQRIEAARTTQRLWIVGLIAFTGVFREGAETVLFLWGIMAQATSAAGWGSVLGGFGGVATAALLGWAIFVGGKSVSLPKFFAATTLFIMFLAAGLFSTGIGRLQGLGLLPLGDPLWDTSSVLSDRSLLGSFLGGLVGYRTQPSALEVGGYLAYLLVVGILVYGRSSPPLAPGPRSTRRQEPVETPGGHS
jgi:high-affinity iron transporter